MLQPGEVVQLSKWRWRLFSKESAKMTPSMETQKLHTSLAVTFVVIMCEVFKYDSIENMACA